MEAIIERVKWYAFYFLNRLADFINPPALLELEVVEPLITAARHDATIWVFCSTIGEFNACAPLISRLSDNGRLVIITDRAIYSDSFHRVLPEAVVVGLSGRITDGEQLVQRFRPNMLVVCEIPALPNDAPCRLSYSVLREAKNAGAGIYLVNTWIYGYPAACRIDSIERSWFSENYISSFDFVTVQTPEVRDMLVSKGLPKGKVLVAGNMKFDVLGVAASTTGKKRADGIFAYLKSVDNQVLVAGSLAGISECKVLFVALREARRRLPGLLIVLAPRHPENVEFMSSFSGLLEENGFTYVLKSQLDTDKPKVAEVIVVDTFGELKSFYEVADICYVGCNHNILEPLSFGKPTVISGTWNTMYPSYPVYSLAVSRGLVFEESDSIGLGDLFVSLLRGDDRKTPESILLVLEDLSGALEVNCRCLGLTYQRPA